MDIKELKKVVLAMDSKRRDDLLVTLVEGVFDDFYEYPIDYATALAESIENITGVDDLVSELPEMF
jgi:hypothetical protein